MIARIDSPEGRMVSLHRTFLSSDGRKASIDGAKRLMQSPGHGITRGGAIRISPANETLGLAEGIETGLACQLAWGIPVWSTVSKTGMEVVTIPDQVKKVVIFADNDYKKGPSRTGQESALLLARRLQREGLKVQVKIPPVQGRDWLDTLVS